MFIYIVEIKRCGLLITLLLRLNCTGAGCSIGCARCSTCGCWIGIGRWGWGGGCNNGSWKIPCIVITN